MPIVMRLIGDVASRKPVIISWLKVFSRQCASRVPGFSGRPSTGTKLAHTVDPPAAMHPSRAFVPTYFGVDVFVSVSRLRKGGLCGHSFGAGVGGWVIHSVPMPSSC